MKRAAREQLFEKPWTSERSPSRDCPTPYLLLTRKSSTSVCVRGSKKAPSRSSASRIHVLMCCFQDFGSGASGIDVPTPMQHPVPNFGSPTRALLDWRQKEFVRRAGRIIRVFRSPFYVVAEYWWCGQLNPPPRWDLDCTNHAWDRIFSQWRNYIFKILYLVL